MPSELAIDLRNVQKVYKRKVHALRGVDMQVRPGEIFGLLGPNGAGKSTLVKIMTTVVRATNASGTLLGKPIGHKPTLRRFGYLPEHHMLPKHLTGRQVLHYCGSLAGVRRADRVKRCDALLETVGMTEWQTMKVGSYSKGMQQRIGLAQALMNAPELVVLDEPTDGVDPVGRREIRDVLVKLRDEGRTVFVNSHLLSELEMVCTRVSILVQGKVAMQGTIDELTRDSRRTEIEIVGPPPDWVASSSDVRVAGTGGDRTTLAVGNTEPEASQPVIDALRADGIMICSVRPVRESLEDLFMRAVTDPKTGETLAPGAGPRPNGGVA
ncbi:MAG: ABC transporter ATP-binding protein [Planctomycetota bacterium]|jgi:ABC-2 type transport system ATP-binding protein